MSGRGSVQRAPVLTVPRPPVRGERGLHPARLPRPGTPPLRQGRGLEPRHGQLHRQLRPVRPLGTISSPGRVRRSSPLTDDTLRHRELRPTVTSTFLIFLGIIMLLKLSHSLQYRYARFGQEGSGGG